MFQDFIPKWTFVFLFLGSHLLLKADCIEGDGTITSQEITVSEFNRLSVSLSVDTMIVRQGNTSGITAMGDSNILEYLTYLEGNNSLEMGLTSGNCYQNFTLNLVIEVPSIEAFNFSGTGNIIIEDFQGTEQLVINKSGVADIEIGAFPDATYFEAWLSGTGSMVMKADFTSLDNYKVSNSGAGLFQGCIINAKTVQVTNSGAGVAIVTAHHYLDVINQGVGDVFYYGSPNINVVNSGLGNVAPGSPSEDCNVINSLNIDQKELPSLGVFPNPARDRLYITIDQQYTPRNGFLLDLLGHPLIQFNIMERQELDISPLPPGTYLIKVGKSSAWVSKI